VVKDFQVCHSQYSDYFKYKMMYEGKVQLFVDTDIFWIRALSMENFDPSKIGLFFDKDHSLTMGLLVCSRAYTSFYQKCMEEAVQRFRDENNTDYQSVGVEVMRHVAEQNICFGEEIDFLTADVYLPYTYLEIDTIIHSPLAKVDPDLTHGIHLFYGHPRISEAIHDPTTPIHKLLFLV
jgi:hypothetical protein